MKLRTKMKGMGLLVSDEKIFKTFAYVKKWPFYKKGRQPKVIIFFKLYWANVSNATYQGPRPLTLWFQKEDFQSFLPYMGLAAIMIMWPRCVVQTFVPPAHEAGSIWNLALTDPVISEEKTFEECGLRTDGGACLYYKLTYEPKGSGELIMGVYFVHFLFNSWLGPVIWWMRTGLEDSATI